MDIDWSDAVGRGIVERPSPYLCELYHQNTKLSPNDAQRLSAQFSATPFEMFVTSRGFRQFRLAPRVPLRPDGDDGGNGAATEDSFRAVLRRRRSSRSVGGAVPAPLLATLLHDALGPTGLVGDPDGATNTVQALRAWPSAGGLYPIDVYVIAHRVTGLEPGLYHYNVLTAELEHRPAREPAAILADGFFWQDFVSSAAVALVFVGALVRTLAKYGDRGYRLALLDAGHAGQNVLLAAEHLGLAATGVGGFHDDGLAADLGLDGVEDVVVHAIVLGGRMEEAR